MDVYGVDGFMGIIHIYLQVHHIIYIKYVQLFTCQSWLNKVVWGFLFFFLVVVAKIQLGLLVLGPVIKPLQTWVIFLITFLFCLLILYTSKQQGNDFKLNDLGHFP